MKLTPPEQYALCSNSNCKNAEHCLRQLCYKQLTANDTKIYVLNPLLFPKEDGECSYFRTDKKVSYAWGIKNILDDIPAVKAKFIKSDLLQRYGRTKYYQFYRGEKPLSVKDQQTFAKIFRQNGVETEIKYADYTEDYDWRY